MFDARVTIEGRPGAVTIEGPGPWLLGRSTDADISFAEDRSCSREQASILRTADGFTLHNLSQTTQTVLDGQPVTTTAPLRDGAVIAFGVQRLVFTIIAAEYADATMIGRLGDAVSDRDRLPLANSFTIGRQTAPGQVVFDHPAISRRHTSFEVRGETVIVRDLGSTNGTFINGVRLDRPHGLAPQDRVDIGPFQFTYDGVALTSVARLGNAELNIREIDFAVRMPGVGRETVRILDRATFEIRPREFVCIMGASGSGKSTLMNIVAGRVAPSAGQVRLNGTNLHANFAALKQDIAFVPQQDVLHEQLTLRQALDYVARLRLPMDTTAAQRQSIIETTARSVDLFERLNTKIARLSGGQKKRASLASEILNRPSLLFLDEVTSGLDESTDWEVMRLLRRLADNGMTIVVVTHTLANVEAFCHKVVCMGRGGHTTFVGSPEEALAFFDVPRLGGIFNRIEEDGPQVWRQRFEATGLETAIAPGQAMAAASGRGAKRRREKPWRAAHRVVRQFAILTDRNLKLLLADRRNLGMAFIQSCLIGGLLGYAFGTFGTGQEAINGQNALLFLLGLTSIWLGCNGASKEIVGELVIYKRERDVNLSTAAFVAAKYVVTGAFTVVQLVLVFLLTALLAERIPGTSPEQLGILLLGALAGTAIGLLISACSNTRDQATTIVPIALVPQIILAGTLVPHLPRPAEIFTKIAISSFWLTEAMKSVFIATDGPIHVISAQTGRMVDMMAEPTRRGVIIVAVHAACFLLLSYLSALFRHGSGKRVS